MSDKFQIDIAKGPNSNEIIRVAIDEFRGNELLNIRNWYKADNGEYKPTQKGISVSTSKYEEIMDALTKAGEHLKKNN